MARRSRDHELERDAYRHLSPRRRERSNLGIWLGASFAVAAFVMVILVVLVVFKARSGAFRPADDAAGATATPAFRGQASFGAIELQQKFDRDQKAFAAIYDGQIVTVTGDVLAVDSEVIDRISILLDSAGDRTHGQEKICVFFRQTQGQKFSASFLEFIDGLQKGLRSRRVGVSGTFRAIEVDGKIAIVIDNAKLQ